MSIHPLCRSYLSHAAVFIPAICFLMVGRFGPGAESIRWHAAWLLGGALAVPHMGWLLKRRAGNWIAPGIDLYLVTGALLATVSTDAMEQWGRGYGAAPALASVFAIGLAATIFSSRGFIGEQHPDPARVRHMSAQLLIAAGIAIALWLRHSPLLGGVVPVLAVLLIRSRLARQLALAR